MKVEIILLAAGQGKRMKRQLPKILLPLGGQPMLFHILSQLNRLKAHKMHIVVGYKEEWLRAQPLASAELVRQKERLGTAHAVAQAIKRVAQDNLVLIIYGDVPLVREWTLKKLIRTAQKNQAVWCIARLENPYGYGRIVRDENGRPCRIVEEKDCTIQQRSIKEANMGVLAASADFLRKGLRRILAQPPDNAQGEYLLTDLMEFAYQGGYAIDTLMTADETEFWGANDMLQLAKLERVLQNRRVAVLAQQGVYFADPSRVDILGSLRAGRNLSIGPNVIFKGQVQLGDGVRIGSHCVIKDCRIAAGTEVRDFCHIEDSRIGKNCVLGPYARVRPQSRIEDEVRIGNFVETKNVQLKAGVKVSHLTYLGDSEIGKQVNVGAGVITCNYDGVRKNHTVIKDGAFIGSNSALVAPVVIGKNAVVGAGSVINKNVQDRSLAVTRADQKEIKNYRSSAAARQKKGKS